MNILLAGNTKSVTYMNIRETAESSHQNWFVGRSDCQLPQACGQPMMPGGKSISGRTIQSTLWEPIPLS